MFEKIKYLVAEYLNLDEEDADEMTMETNLMRDLWADSLDMIEIFSAIEDEFGCEIPSEDFERIKTVGDLVNYIEQL
jgi:acyl carrier protein